MVVLKKDTIQMFENCPEILSEWMRNLSEMRELLISIFVSYNIHGWQGLSSALSRYGFDFEIKELIIFYSRFELSEKLLDVLLDLNLKLISE